MEFTALKCLVLEVLQKLTGAGRFIHLGQSSRGQVDHGSKFLHNTYFGVYGPYSNKMYPRDPSIPKIFSLGPKVYEHCLHWADWIRRVLCFTPSLCKT